MPATVNPRLPLLLNKVPEVTAIFWIIKILSTTVGETGADYLAVHVGLGASATITSTAPGAANPTTPVASPTP